MREQKKKEEVWDAHTLGHLCVGQKLFLSRSFVCGMDPEGVKVLRLHIRHLHWLGCHASPIYVFLTKLCPYA